MKKRLVLLFLLIIILSMLSACQLDIVRAEPEIQNIYVDGIGEYYYFVGDELNLENAYLYVEYENNEIEVLPLEKSMIDESFTTHFPGEISVKVNYKGVSTTFAIEILDSAIDKVMLKSMPDRTTYIEGTDFEVDGATIDVHFEGGRVINVQVLKNNVIRYNPSALGPQIVKVSYRGRILDIPIEIVPKTLESISVNTRPRNRAVFVGQQINPAGMVIDFHYDNGMTEAKRIEELVNVDFTFNNTSETTSTPVTVKYTLYLGVGEYVEFFTTFPTQVLRPEWVGMEIIEYPRTYGKLIAAAQYDEFGNLVRDEIRLPSTGVGDIIQGDELDLSTGKVEVTFRDGTKKVFTMDDHLLKVYNEETVERAEIQGLVIDPIAKTGVPAGNCRIDYTIRKTMPEYIYDTDPDIKISARTQAGRNVPIKISNEREVIEVNENEIYTVTITATVIEQREDTPGNIQEFELITVKTFKILTIGAVEPRKSLDIASAGEYRLSVIYMENPAWSVVMNAKVIGKEPQELELMSYSAVTEDTYVIGDRIDISSVKYRMKYNNGDVDAEWMPVTISILSPECTLNCDFVTDDYNKKTITFTVQGITSRILNVTVVPLKVIYLEIDPPINTYVAQGASINPRGAILTANMNNKEKLTFTLSSIIGVGADFAEIINDPLSQGNTIINLVGNNPPQDPYTATVYYKGAVTTFDYYVVDREVESIRLVTSENAKSSYFENEEISLDGLSIQVKWKNSTREDTMAVTEDMLYKFDKHRLGSQTLRIRYRGVLNESFIIHIEPRIIELISKEREPRTTYIFGIDTELDIFDIRIKRTFNDGSSDYLYTIRLGLDERGYGWTYNIEEINFALLEQPQTIKLMYYDQYHIDEPLIIEYEITVKRDGVKNIYLNHPEEGGGSDVITSVPKGMDLNLYDVVIDDGQIVLRHKVIYVEFHLSSTIREVILTAEMINYEKTNITVEDREVQVKYNDVTCTGIVRVLDWELRAISVEKIPKTKYVLGEDLDLTDGILKRTFRDASNQPQYDYIPMYVEGVTSSGFDGNLQESDYGEDEDYKRQTIIIYYGNFNCNFAIRIYKKFNANISYFSTVSFYGDVSLPYVTVNEDVEEFTLPETNTYFINLTDIQATLPQNFTEEVTTDLENNIVTIRYRVGEEYYFKILLEDNTQRYVSESKIMTYNYYPKSPAQGQNRYLILVQVLGNKYYNALNYAKKEFRIINKYINVNAVVPNEKAIVWEYNTSDNGRAIYLLTAYIDNLVFSDSSLNIILASPTYESFEIIIISYGAWNLTVLKEQIETVITEMWWSYVEVVLDENGQPLLDDFGNIITKIKEVKQNNAPPNVNNPQEKKLKILSRAERIGVNYEVYGDSREIISYYVPSGGLIAIRDDENFFVMELFTGELYRADPERADVLYDADGQLINGFNIENDEVFQQETIVSGYEILLALGQSTSLNNPNYFLSFQSRRYTIAPKVIVEAEFLECSYNEELGGLLLSTVFDNQAKRVAVRYRTEQGGTQIDLDISQIRYYYIDGEDEISLPEGEFPIEKGLYRARITHNFQAKEGYQIIWESYLRIT